MSCAARELRVWKRAVNNDGFVDLGFARPDVARGGRTGFGEVIFAAGKTPHETVAIARTLLEHQPGVLVTRTTAEHRGALATEFGGEAAVYERARCVTVSATRMPRHPGLAAVVCAGTSDLPVADEAAVTLEFLGFATDRINDVGVAGLHRLLAVRNRFERADVIVVVAGMEGALPSVIGGLVAQPVVAVPASVGYGAGAGGFAALAGMLTSCASGLAVVNIDNGFGGAMAAARMLQRMATFSATQPEPAP